MSNITVEKIKTPFKSNLKWRVVIGHDCYPLKPSIYGSYSTKKRAMEVVKNLEKMICWSR